MHQQVAHENAVYKIFSKAEETPFLNKGRLLLKEVV
jgi:hypothetical protein